VLGLSSTVAFLTAKFQPNNRPGTTLYRTQSYTSVIAAEPLLKVGFGSRPVLIPLGISIYGQLERQSTAYGL
jgi:hypothetical protein